jgi:Mg-chelatase subunit ChlD
MKVSCVKVSRVCEFFARFSDKKKSVLPFCFWSACFNLLLLGNTFERAAIEAWLLKNATSPVTRSPLSIDKLAPNRALKEAIDAFRAANAKHVAKIAPKALAGSIALTCRAFERAGDEGTHDVVITMDAGAGVARSPVDLVCVIDISGSMDSEATVADASGKKEEHGLSLLDITKHAVATVINTLGPSDRLALVTYSDKARVDFPLSQMNIKGQQKASDVLAKMKTEGSTNLWDGLKTGMDVLRDSERQGRIPSVFLLTDGQPNVAPPRGHLEMLKRYKDENKINFTVQTFGFGYNLDSKLLDELATEGGGAYAFVPEPMFVGTSFV